MVPNLQGRGQSPYDRYKHGVSMALPFGRYTQPPATLEPTKAAEQYLRAFRGPFVNDIATQFADNSNHWREYKASIPKSKQTFGTTVDSTTCGATPGAFQGSPSGPVGYSPSAYNIYNDWAIQALEEARNNRVSIGKNLANQAEFDEWHQKLAASLNSAWQKNAHPDFHLSPRQKLKLVNLFVKWLATKAATAPGLKEAILENGHVTLNTPTIAKMMQIFGTRMPTCAQRPTEVEFKAWYLDCQELVRTYTSAEGHGGSPVLFDIWCRKDSLDTPEID